MTRFENIFFKFIHIRCGCNYTKHSKKHSYIVNIKKESILDVDNILMFFKEPYFMKVRRWRLIGNAAQLKYKKQKLFCF